MWQNFRLAFIAFAVLIAGCQTQQGPANASNVDRTVVTPEHLNWITDVEWTLERVIVDGRPVALAKSRPWVRFGLDGRVTGFGSVNRLFGLMQIQQSGHVRWPGALASTRMAGPPALMRQEETFMNALQTVKQWSIEGIKLYGQNAEGSTQLVFTLPTP